MSITPTTCAEVEANRSAICKIQKLFPSLTHDELPEFLISATPYPFKSLTDCAEILEAVAPQIGGSVDHAKSLYCEQLYQDMLEEKREMVRGKV